MLVTYMFNGENINIVANWTNIAGESDVFQDIIRKLRKKHGDYFSQYYDYAIRLDYLTDKLYEQIYIFGDEYHAVPYNPKTRKLFIEAFSDICDGLSQNTVTQNSIFSEVVLELFNQVLDKLQEIVGIYLLDNAYQGKSRFRRVNFELWFDNLDERVQEYELESEAIDTYDANNILDTLTKIQRRRLVEYIYLKNTLQEIADKEGVSKFMVHKSVTSALNRIRKAVYDK